MGYQKRYDTETKEGRDEAYADAKEWLGEARLEAFERAIQNETIANMKQLRFILDLAGLSGFPVRVIGERSGLYD